jgi:hypothetical protein
MHRTDVVAVEHHCPVEEGEELLGDRSFANAAGAVDEDDHTSQRDSEIARWRDGEMARKRISEL